MLSKRNQTVDLTTTLVAKFMYRRRFEILYTDVPFTAKPVKETDSITSPFAVHHNQLFTIKGKAANLVALKR